jgi:DNA (cytosine-5)-methyltransferase 1
VIYSQLLLDVHGELIVDLFAGGGGASCGIEMALGRMVDVAVNHDADAVAMHRMNHPQTKHLRADVFEVDPREVTGGRPVGVLWASPDCTFHSKARGAKPIRSKERKRRALAWVVTRWAGQVRPRVILLENVEEFAGWGPLVGPPHALRPCKRRRGRTFRKWVRSLERYGYTVDWRERRAYISGAKTIRKRLYLIARCDGRPIVWPEAEFGDPKSEAVRGGLARPWRTAAECIDWTIPMLSIFATREEAKEWGKRLGVPAPVRPLAEATMRRIARGVKRYVVDNPTPFITHHGERRPHVPTEPMPTVTGAQRGELALVAPLLTECANASGQRNMPTDEPLRTQCADVKAGHFALVAPYMVPRYGERDGQEPRARSVEEPAPVVVPTGNGGSLVGAYLAPYRSERREGEARGSMPGEPLDTIDTANRHAVVAAYLAQHNAGHYDRSGCAGAPLTRPASTVLGKGAQQALVSASLVKLRGTSSDADPAAPLHTASAGGTHHGLVAVDLAQWGTVARGLLRNPPLVRYLGHPERFRAPRDPRDRGFVVGLPRRRIRRRKSTRTAAAANLFVNTTGHPGGPADAPAPTITTGGQTGVVAAHLSHTYTRDPDGGNGDPAAPARTVTAKSHAGLVYAFLDKYYGTDQDPRVDEPLHTTTTKDRFGVVTVEVDGTPMVITDIAMRMLQPRELYRAQGFPDSYIIDRGMDEDGRVYPLTKTEQVRMCGNSVCPTEAAALVRANVPEMIVRDEARPGQEQPRAKRPRRKRIPAAPLRAELAAD